MKLRLGSVSMLVAILTFAAGIFIGIAKQKVGKSQAGIHKMSVMNDGKSTILRRKAVNWKHSNKTEKGTIARQLVNEQLLIGKSDKDIRELLGSPDGSGRFKTIWKKGKILYYHLINEKSLCIGIKENIAVIAFYGKDSDLLVANSSAMEYKNPKVLEIKKVPRE